MEKVRRKNSRHYIDNMSIKNSFVFYALISLVIGIVIGVISITLVDDYRINLNYKYEDMTTRYDIPENGSFTAKYNKDQTEYTIYKNVFKNCDKAAFTKAFTLKWIELINQYEKNKGRATPAR